MTKPVQINQGSSPLILAMPHTGTYVPDTIMLRLNSRGQNLADTDWYIDQLYKDLAPNASIVRANFHRYVIDANRDPSGQSLYPGQNTTGLCPVIDFDGKTIYEHGLEPNAPEIEQRRIDFHAPYHQALLDEVSRVRKEHGHVILYDCHSIRAQAPFLFDGTLPDFNIGTHDGAACAPELEQLVSGLCKKAKPFTYITNGRFKGGWTTRHYGQPKDNVHALQMELSQSTYMANSPAYAYLPEKAANIRQHLRRILTALETLALHKKVFL